MRRLLILCSLILAGCGDQFNTPVKREYTDQSRTITWQEVDTEGELNAACGRSGEDKRILGCAYMHRQTASCTIFTYRNPSLDVLGHEMLHCFTGRWHS